MKNSINTSESEKGLNTLNFYNVAFVVSDIDKAIEWYNSVLDFELLMKQSIPLQEGKVDVVFMEGGGMKIEMIQNSENQLIEAIKNDAKLDALPTVIGSKALVFHVEDLKEASMELEKKGVEFVWRERYLSEEALLCSMILDFDGNRINIFQADTLG